MITRALLGLAGLILVAFGLVLLLILRGDGGNVGAIVLWGTGAIVLGVILLAAAAGRLGGPR